MAVLSPCGCLVAMGTRDPSDAGQDSLHCGLGGCHHWSLGQWQGSDPPLICMPAGINWGAGVSRSSEASGQRGGKAELWHLRRKERGGPSEGRRTQRGGKTQRGERPPAQEIPVQGGEALEAGEASACKEAEEKHSAETCPPHQRQGHVASLPPEGACCHGLRAGADQEQAAKGHPCQQPQASQSCLAAHAGQGHVLGPRQHLRAL